MRTIIVTGYHRSGTSLTAGILHHLGVDMGSNWREEDEANEKGYFENKDFVKANQAILEEGKVPDLEKIVDKHKSELWGAKDPRFLDTWEHWDFPNPHIIVCMRAIDSIAKSVCYRDDGRFSKAKKYDDVVEDIARYQKNFRKIKGYPTLYVQYEDYFKDDKQIRKIAKFVGVRYKKVDLVDPNLKHF